MKHPLRFVALVVTTLAVAACAAGGPKDGKNPSLSAADYGPILADPGRPTDDKKDDAARKPAEVLAFAQIRPGDTILEMEAGRGWYSEILSTALGPSGKLIIQYPPQFTYGEAAFKARTDAGRLKNSTVTVTAFDKLQAESNSVDKVLWILGPHEIYFTPRNAPPGVLGDAQKTYAEIVRVLKPGGTFIAMDHAAEAGAPTTTGQTIHRVDPAVVLAAAKAAGLVCVDKSEVLANASDDRSKGVFDATVRRHTDQFLFRFPKTQVS